MKKKDWYYIIGGVGVVAVGYYLYSMAKPKPTGQKYLPEYGTQTENPLSSLTYIKRIVLSQARDDEELNLSAKYISVLKSTGSLSIKINDRSSAQFDLTEVRSISANIEKIFLTNVAQSDCYVDLIISEGSMNIEYYPTQLPAITQGIATGYSVLTVSVIATPVTASFLFPEGIKYTKSVDFIVTGPAVSVKIITPTSNSLKFFTIPDNSYFSVPITATGITFQLASGTASSNLEARGWY